MDEHAGLEAVRRAALSRVEAELRRRDPDLTWTLEPIKHGHGPGMGAQVTGVKIDGPLAGDHARVLVVATKRLLPEGRGGMRPGGKLWIMDTAVDHALTAGFDTLTYEVTILEETGEGSGRHAVVVQERFQDPAEVAETIVTWSRYPEGLAAPPAGPIGPAEHRRLRAVAEAKITAVEAPPIDHDLDPGAMDDLTPGSRRDLDDDLAAFLPAVAAWNLPRDSAGKLELGFTALLAAYETRTPQPQGRRLWLCLQGPERRRDEQHARMRLLSLIGPNHEHRWDEARWLWDAREQNLSLEERWGIEDAERVAACVELQDRGELEGAMALWDVNLDAPLGRLLRGEPVRFSMGDRTAIWASRVQETVRAAALWLLVRADERSSLVRAEWAKAKRRRGDPTAGFIRMAELGGYNQQRRPGILLGRGPRLVMGWTGSNARVPVHAWMRPIDHDLVRHGVIDRTMIPR